MKDRAVYVIFFLLLVYISWNECYIGNRESNKKKNDEIEKLTCQGVFIYKEQRNIEKQFKEEPHFAIYKRNSNGFFFLQEHFPGLSIFTKQKIKNYESDKRKTVCNFLLRIFYYNYNFSKEEYEKLLRKCQKKEDIELLKTLNKNFHGLFTENENYEKVYNDCVTSSYKKENNKCISTITKEKEGKKKAETKIETKTETEECTNNIKEINKRCLSHNYLLFSWQHEQNIVKKEKEEEKGKEKLADIWSFTYISITDLLISKFDIYIKKYFLGKLKSTNRYIYNLFLFYITYKAIKNVNVTSFVEKAYHNFCHNITKITGRNRKKKYNNNNNNNNNNKNNNNNNKNNKPSLHFQHSGTSNIPCNNALQYEYHFTISFDFFTKNKNSDNNDIDTLSFFFPKFVCKNEKKNTFYMNSFENNKIYVHSEKEAHSKIYENHTYTFGMKHNVFIFPYLFANVPINQKETEREKKEKEKREIEKEKREIEKEKREIEKEEREKREIEKEKKNTLDYQVEKTPLLFHNHLYSLSDYIFYDEKKHRIFSNKQIKKAYIKKEILGEGLNKKSKTIISIYKNKMEENFFFLKKCVLTSVDLYPNLIIIDKEKVKKNIHFSFVNIENIQDESSHILTKYEDNKLIKHIFFSFLATRIYRRIHLMVPKKSENDKWKKLKDTLLCEKKNAAKKKEEEEEEEEEKKEKKEKEKKEQADKSKENFIKEKKTKKEKRKNFTLNKNFISISYKVPLSSRYISPCDKKENKKNEMNICTNYEMLPIYNAKLFLNCSYKKNENNYIKNNSNENDIISNDDIIPKEYQNQISYISSGSNITNSNVNKVYTYLENTDISIFADFQKVYIKVKATNIIITLVNDFYIFLYETSFPSVFQSVTALENGTNNNDEKEMKKEKLFVNKDPFTFVHEFLYVPLETNNTKIKIFNFNKIHNDTKFKYNVVEANDVHVFPFFSNFHLVNFINKAFVLSDTNIIYLYSIPRGSHNFYFILLISGVVSFFIIAATFYLSYIYICV